MNKEIIKALGNSKKFDISANNDYVAEMLEGQLDNFIKNKKIKLSDDDFEKWVEEIQVLCAECYKHGWERALEDAEKSEAFIKPPCKVGDRLYSIPFGNSRQIFKHTVTGFALLVVSKTEEGDHVETYFEWFGDHAFLTREQAEKRLEELKGEME